MRENSKVLKKSIEILFMLLLFMICDLTGTEKYVFVLGMTIVFLIFGRKKYCSIEPLLVGALPVLTYLIIGSITAVLHATVYETTIKLIVFWTLPLLFAMSLYIVKNMDMTSVIDIEMIGCCLAYLLINGRFLIYIMKVESMFSFAFGVFFLYYAYKKRWKMCTVAAFFLWLTDKRITMLAAVVALILMFIIRLFRNDKRITYFIWILLGTFVYEYLYLIGSGKFAYYSKGIGINTNGRTEMYTRIIEWCEEPFLLCGKGIGIVEKLLNGWNVSRFSNLHNDLLKFYIELGAIGLSVFLLSYLVMLFLVERWFGEKKAGMVLCLSIYTILLYATDNVSIYILYLIPFYSILFAVLSDAKEITGREEKGADDE